MTSHADSLRAAPGERVFVQPVLDGACVEETADLLRAIV